MLADGNVRGPVERRSSLLSNQQVAVGANGARAVS